MSTASLPHPVAAPEAGRPLPRDRARLVANRVVAMGLAGAGLAAAWQGGAMALAGVLAVLAGGWVVQRSLLSRPATAPTAAGDAAPQAEGLRGRSGTETMVSQVIPVWGRQLEVTRDVCADGLAKLLESFAGISDTLGQLTEKTRSFSPSADSGTIDSAVAQAQPALQALVASSTRAFAERDAAVAELGRHVDGLAELGRLAKQARELARHTRLVAFNASIEAHRGAGVQDGGSQAVAGEVRMLATRFAETGDRIDKLVAAMLATASRQHRAAVVADTTPDEVRLEIELHARQALTALLGGLGESVRANGEIEQAGAELSARISDLYVHFQFGDRVAQMLAIVGNDMGRLVKWLAEHPHATQSDAAQWLAELADSYTMEEQRSHHHGNVHIERSSGVEFF